MENLKKLAKEFCEAENMNHKSVVFDKTGLGAENLEFILSKFAKSLLDKGVLVEADKYKALAERLEQEYKRGDKMATSILKQSNNTSTVSSAGKEVKTLQDFKDYEAVKMGYKSWKTMYPKLRFHKLLILTEQAAEQYANQFKSSPDSSVKVISDEDIEAYIEKSLPGWKSDGEWTGKAYSMRSGAKWMREQLTGKP